LRRNKRNDHVLNKLQEVREPLSELGRKMPMTIDDKITDSRRKGLTDVRWNIKGER
jgi:hypothetical protein